MRLLFILLIACLSSCSEKRKSSELLMINLDEISYEPMDISAVADSVIILLFFPVLYLCIGRTFAFLQIRVKEF